MKTNEIEDKLDVMELMAVKGGTNSEFECNGGNSGVHCNSGAVTDKQP